MKNILKNHKNELSILAMVLLLNLIFWLISEHYGLGRVFFNLDYLLLGILCYKKDRITSTLFFIFFVIFYCVELMLFGLKLFPFINFNDFLYLSTFIFGAPPLYRIIVFVVILAVFVIFYFLKNYIFDIVVLSKKSVLTMAVLIIGLFGVSLFNHKILVSQTYFFIKNFNSSMVQATDGKIITELTSEYASKPLVEQIKNNQPISNKILFIVSESWSETTKPEQQQAILKNIYAQKDNFEFIKQGSFSIVGATVMGEVRELCQKKLVVMDAEKMSGEELKDCIPHILKKQNYVTSAIHGANYNLYARDYWYPLVGLDNRYFVNDLPEGGQCNTFSGRCDVLLTNRVKELLLESDKSFVYWMTLNSHAPYDDEIFIDGFDCNAVGLQNDTWVCGNYKLHYQFFTALAEMIKDPALKGLEVYVVGDHPAPVANIKEGLTAFKGSDVAWLHFKINDK